MNTRHFLAPTLFVLQLIQIAPAFALFGEELPQSDLIPQACKLMFDEVKYLKTPVDPQGRPTGPEVVDHIDTTRAFCSATLVGKNEILTAAHCSWMTFARNLGSKPENGFRYAIRYSSKVNAVCHGIDGKQEVRPLLWTNGWFHPYYTDDQKTAVVLPILNDDTTAENPDRRFSQHGMGYLDVALFRTEEAFTIPPVEMARTSDQVEKLLLGAERDPTSCRAFGWGINDRGTTGELVGVRAYGISNRRFIFVSRSAINSAGPGDSGGTVVCRDPQTKKDILVGVMAKSNTKNPLDIYEIDPSRYAKPSGVLVAMNIGFGPHQRFIRHFLEQVPQNMRHTGRVWQNFDHATNKTLLEYEIPFLVNSDIPALMKDLRECIDTYADYYSTTDKKEWKRRRKAQFKRMMEGYEESLVLAEKSYACGKSQFDDWLSGSPMISGCQWKVIGKSGKTMEESENLSRHGIYTAVLTTDFKTPRKDGFHLSYVDHALEPALQLLHTELRSCAFKGFGNDGKNRFKMPEAEQILHQYWENR